MSQNEANRINNLCQQIKDLNNKIDNMSNNTSHNCINELHDECPNPNTIVSTNPNKDYVSILSNNGLVVKAFDQSDANIIPESGAGVKMLFVPGAFGAFRSGEIEGTQWDMAFVGLRSTAHGFNTKSTGDSSFSSGFAENSGTVIASGMGSFVSGYSTNNGSLNESRGDGSASFGYVNSSGQIISIGDGSFASGFSSGQNSKIETSSFGSHAFGYANSAGQIKSSREGSFTNGLANNFGQIISSNEGSFANGWASSSGSKIEASGQGAVAIGYTSLSGQIISSNDGSFASGWTSITGSKIEASNKGAHAFGYAYASGQIISSYEGSFASGWAISEGSKIESSREGSFAVGYSNASGQIISSNEGSFSGGWAQDGSIIESSGKGSKSFGYANTSGQIKSLNDGSFSGGWSVSLGSKIESSGFGSHAFGYANNSGQLIASSDGSFSNGFVIDEGSRIDASAQGSHASGYASGIGNIIADGNGSFANGYVISESELTRASGLGSAAFGRDVETGLNYSMIIGKHGIASILTNGSGGVTGTNPGVGNTNIIDGEASLQIAGGTDSSNRDISVVIGTSVFGLTSVGGGIADFWHTSGADYAELFEWADGNVNNEDRVGYFVKLNKGKIIISNNNEKVIGVVSSNNGTSGYIADNHEKKWHKSLKTDGFGRRITKLSYKNKIINIFEKYSIKKTNEINEILKNDDNYELITKLTLLNFDNKIKEELKNIIPQQISILNPEYNPSLPYTPRSSRKEWIPVGLIGKVYVRDNGLCQIGEYCDCNENGIAIPGNTWSVLDRSAENIIKILFK